MSALELQWNYDANVDNVKDKKKKNINTLRSASLPAFS